MRYRKRSRVAEAELDITSFMNLMIILVPVLLMTMVFSRITVLELKLPDAGPNSAASEEERQLELVLRENYIDVNYPAGIRLKRIDQVEEKHDYVLLSNVLQEVKRQLREKDIEKRDILILAQEDTDYQTLITVMDTVRSFDAVVATSVVQGELFPDISLGDAPVTGQSSAKRGAK